MNLHLINFGEPLPIDPIEPRNFRGGLLVKYLEQEGHQVTWWASGFDHHLKRTRSKTFKVIQHSPLVKICLIPAPEYRKNISFSRFLNHIILGRNLRKHLSKLEEKPDIIFSCFPPIETSSAAVKYANKNKIPIIIDARDRWPELIVEQAPQFLRSTFRLMLTWYYSQTFNLFKNANYLTGTSDGMLDFALHSAQRKKTISDRTFLMSYERPNYNTKESDDAKLFWDKLDVSNGEEMNICFFGTFVSQLAVDIGTCIEGLRLLENEGLPVKLILCGSGPRLDELSKQSKGLKSVIIPGRVTGNQIWELMKRSHLGLLPYKPESHFFFSIPNKVPEYLSGSLPIITSLKEGTLKDLLKKRNTGFFYNSGDPDSFAELIRNLNEDKKVLIKESKKAKLLYEDIFNSSKIYPEVINWVDKIFQESLNKNL